MSSEPSSPGKPGRVLVRVDVDQLCRNLSLRLGIAVSPPKANRWLRNERFEPINDVWACDPAALDALEPDEFETLGPYVGEPG